SVTGRVALQLGPGVAAGQGQRLQVAVAHGVAVDGDLTGPRGEAGGLHADLVGAVRHRQGIGTGGVGVCRGAGLADHRHRGAAHGCAGAGDHAGERGGDLRGQGDVELDVAALGDLDRVLLGLEAVGGDLDGPGAGRGIQLVVAGRGVRGGGGAVDDAEGRCDRTVGAGDLAGDQAGVRCAGGRRIGVDDAVAVGVVGSRAHERVGAGGLLEDLLQLVNAESRVGGQHEGRDAADVRRGHRGAGDRVVVLPGVAGPRGVDLGAGGADLGLDVFHAVPGDRAAAGEGGDVVVDVGRPDTDGVRVAAGEPDGAAGRAVVAVGEHRHDARGAPGRHRVPEGAAGAGAAAPGVAGDVRGLGRVATGGEHPLHAGQDADLAAAAAVGEDLD